MFSMRKKNLKFHSKCGKLPNPFFHVNLAFISVGSVHRREIQKGENPRVLFELHLLLWPDSNQAYNNNTSYKNSYFIDITSLEMVFAAILPQSKYFYLLASCMPKSESKQLVLMIKKSVLSLLLSQFMHSNPNVYFLSV